MTAICRECRASPGLAFDCPRVVDIEIDMVTGDRRGHHRHAIRGVDPVPGALRNDGHGSGAECARLGPALFDDIQVTVPSKT